ncbi:hypothetical protein RMCBS344292_02572 [Rhizopus microsporus]|nr:hypothetical protein RMCBS344292_02572 [Rhizopus microsporus]
MSLDKKRVHHISAPISPLGIANNKPLDSLYEDYPPPAYQPPQVYEHNNHFYHPTPPPQTVIIHRQPTKSKDSCCWGCLAALCLCFGAKECC